MSDNKDNNENQFLRNEKAPLSKESVEALFRPQHLEKYSTGGSIHASELKEKKIKRKHIFIFFLALIFAASLFLVYFNRHPLSPYNKRFIYLKAPSPDFVGRESYLRQLYEDFKLSRKERELKNNILIRELWGKGGIGKSELAIEFANRHLNDFSIVWTFFCDTPENLEQGYRHLAEELQIFTEKESFEKLVKKVHFYLENNPYRLPWLLIYDNVEKPLVNYPERGGMVLITSQKKVLNHDHILEIQPFSKDETVQLLSKITHEDKGKAMQDLAKDLEGIPLLINCAARYIKTTPGCTIADYQKLFSSNIPEEEGSLWKKTDANQRYFKTLAASWQFPLKALEKEYPEALEWLYICSYLYPENICEEWIDLWLATNSSQDKDSLQIKRKQILKALLDFGIIRYEQSTHTLSLHRFLQYMIRETRKTHQEEDLGCAVSTLAKCVKDQMFKRSLSWQQEKFWHLHACELTRWLDSFPHENSKTIDPKEEANLYEGIAWWGIINNEKYEDALHANYKVLKLRQAIMPSNSPEIGVAYENIGEVFYKMGYYPESLNACKMAQEILQSCQNEKPLEFALTLNTMGLIFWETGEYEKALKVHNEALNIRKKELGMHHYQVAYSMNNTSLCLRDLGRYDEALQLCEKALEIYQSIDKEHPWYVWALQNKGWILFYTNQSSQGLKIFQQALALDSILRGSNHAGLAYSYNGIGWCNSQLGNFSKAKKAFKKGLKLGIVNEGKNARPVLRAYKGLMWTYLKNRQFDKGFHYGVQYLNGTSKTYKDTPKMALALEDFQKAMAKASELSAPLEQLQSAGAEAYNISNNMLGKDHALTRFFRENYVVSSNSEKKESTSNKEAKKRS